MQKQNHFGSNVLFVVGGVLVAIAAVSWSNVGMFPDSVTMTRSAQVLRWAASTIGPLVLVLGGLIRWLETPHAADRRASRTTAHQQRHAH